MEPDSFLQRVQDQLDLLLSRKLTVAAIRHVFQFSAFRLETYAIRFR